MSIKWINEINNNRQYFSLVEQQINNRKTRASRQINRVVNNIIRKIESGIIIIDNSKVEQISRYEWLLVLNGKINIKDKWKNYQITLFNKMFCKLNID